MRLLYMKPKLVDLSQGSRIAFVRQFRHMTQDEVSDRLGVTGECKRRTMTRYEKGNRNPKEDRIKDLANILNVSVNSIKQYDYKKPTDLIYSLMWLEELIPNYIIDISKVAFTDEQYIRLFKIAFDKWNIERTKRIRKEISYDEYLNWKLNFEMEDVVDE